MEFFTESHWVHQLQECDNARPVRCHPSLGLSETRSLSVLCSVKLRT